MMNNQMLLDEFVGYVKSGKIIEHGLQRKTVNFLKDKFDVFSFDPGSSTFAMVPTGFRANAMMHLPFNDNEFNGAILNNAFKNVGDREFFFSEIVRIVSGFFLFIDSSIDAFPLRYLEGEDRIYVVSASINGKQIEIGQTWEELIARRDFKKLFRNPGGGLNKFSMLVPEDIKTEMSVLCKKL